LDNLIVGRMNWLKALTIAGFVIVSGALFVFGVGVMIFRSGAIEEEEVFIPFIEASVPKLVPWDLEQYKKLLSDKGYSAVSDEEWVKYLQIMSKLGDLITVGNPEKKEWKRSLMFPTGFTHYATYEILAEFETGPARISLMLNHNDETKIDGVGFYSDIFKTE
jgi:hypothetical protein